LQFLNNIMGDSDNICTSWVWFSGMSF